MLYCMHINAIYALYSLLKQLYKLIFICSNMELPKLREDISSKDVLAFLALIAFLIFWWWLTFESGYLF